MEDEDLLMSILEPEKSQELMSQMLDGVNDHLNNLDDRVNAGQALTDGPTPPADEPETPASPEDSSEASELSHDTVDNNPQAAAPENPQTSDTAVDETPPPASPEASAETPAESDSPLDQLGEQLGQFGSIFETIKTTFKELTDKLKEALIGAFPFLENLLNPDAAEDHETDENAEDDDESENDEGTRTESDREYSESTEEVNYTVENLPEEYWTLARNACDLLDIPEAMVPHMLAIILVESGGDPNSQNSHSTALGLAQFLDDTFADYAHRYGPRLIDAGLISEEDLFRDGTDRRGRRMVNMEAKRDPLISIYFLAAYTNRSYNRLRERNLLSDGMNTPRLTEMLYQCHHDGRGNGVAVIQAGGPYHPLGDRAQRYSTALARQRRTVS